MMGMEPSVDEHELFNQLFHARCGQPPYDKFADWTDMNLWCEIVKKLKSLNPHSYPTVSNVLKVIMIYLRVYKADPELKTMRLNPLRDIISLVFGSFSDRKGCLTFDGVHTPQNSLSAEMMAESVIDLDRSGIDALIEKCKERERGDKMEMKKLRKQSGYVALLSQQYAEDLKALTLGEVEKQWLIMHYGPISSQYIVIANDSCESRINILRRLSQNVTQ